jgi:uncharacterized protein YigE (DUF2233 family)
MDRITVLLCSLLGVWLAVAPAFADDAPATVTPPAAPVAPAPIAPPVARFSTAPEAVRVVVELPGEVAVTDKSTPAAIMVTVPLPLEKALPAQPIADPVVSGYTLAPDAAGQLTLTITLLKPRKAKVFTVPAGDGKPFRLVVDVLKRFSVEEARPLTPGVTYTRIERQTDDRYLAAHVVEVTATDPHVRLAVAAAGGGRETVGAMVTRLGAVAGVNGGYFGNATRPLGLLKADGQLLSLPLWGRTAAAFPAGGLPVFGNPTGAWRLTLPDGTTRDVPEALDASVQTPPPAALAYTGGIFGKVPATTDGFTVLLREGKVAQRTGDVLILNPGDLAIQFRGDDAKALDAVLVPDAAVAPAPVLAPDWAEFPTAVGAGPRLLRGGQLAVTADAERFKPDIRNGRNARTGLGVTRDGRVVLAAVEPVGPYGGGATLEELAALLQSRGAVDAMNLDGGGSTTLAVGPLTVTASPGAWIRPVASGVLVFDDRLAPPPPPPPLPPAPAPPPTEAMPVKTDAPVAQ